MVLVAACLVVALGLGAKIGMTSWVIISTCQWHSTILPQMIVLALFGIVYSFT